MTDEPRWLTWTRELQAIAQTGLAFVRDPYDRERYEMLRALASRMMAAHTALPAERIEDLFRNEQGYATPKVDVRGAVFDSEGRLLMVREVADSGRWTLPGGWADVNLSPAENVVKEVREESGFDVRVRKLAALWDRTRQGHPASVFSCCKMFYVCELVGGSAATSMETSEVGWFAEDAVPQDLSLGRVLPHQIRRMFDHLRDATLPTDFEQGYGQGPRALRLDLPVLRSWTDPFTVPSPLPSMNLLRNLAVRAARVAEVLAEARVITQLLGRPGVRKGLGQLGAGIERLDWLVQQVKGGVMPCSASFIASCR